ncbi:MAG: hypothetical protein CFE34_09445 [Rhodobacteraceae bacterium PARR1]|nr:MAG: hypothetical protein CFE34_09445 [Rhodobacteraceae bacterium PARR1]
MFIPTIVFLASIVIILCFWWADQALHLGAWMGLEVDKVTIGDWGDSFSALNTAFSGLALLGLGATVYQQLKFSERQRIEVGKAEFERLFFQMFSLIRELRGELRFSNRSTVRDFPTIPFSAVDSSESKEKLGVDAIKSAYYSITRAIDAPELQKKKRPLEVERVYNAVVNRRFEAEFSPYFRAIYSLLRSIDTSRHLTQEDRLYYSRLLRSQMTSHEVILLGLNGLSKNSKDLEKYIVKYRMLKYSADGVVKLKLRQRYPQETFSGR